jgi:glyoxylase-like metal-dependent hydrolase (beta-lactamase superfamily II)
MMRGSTLLGAAVAAMTAVTAAAPGPAAGQAAPGPKQRYQKVADGVYAALPAPGSDVAANSGFVIGTRGVTVFDALRPDVVKEMLAAIKAITPLPVTYVVNSHHHYELVMGNSVFEGATIISHVNARRQLVDNPIDKQMERTRASNQQLGLPNSAPEATTPAPVRLPDVTYTDRLAIYDGTRELQVIHLGRYHTDADSVLFLPKEKVLFSGDLLPGIGGPGGQREAYFRDFIRSIDTALTLDFDTIVPGRGDRLATKEDLRNFQQYLRELLTQVQGFVDRSASKEDTVAGVKPPAYLDPKRLETASFKRLWNDSVQRAYDELKGAKTQQPNGGR